MKKTKIILCSLLFTCFFAFCDESNFFIDLRSKDLATFNDAVTLMRYVFAETTPTIDFRENIVWAAEKKLFKVSIPIETNTVNPIITREEFCNWLCKLFEIGGRFIPRNGNAAYKRCLTVGIVLPGRGANDSFTGAELLDTFSYFDSYVRRYNIKKRYDNLPLFDDTYDDLPKWRKKLYMEHDSQIKMELQLNKKKKNENSDEIDLLYVE